MVRIAVIGDADSIKGFAAVGLDIFPCVGHDDALACLKRLAAGEYGIIYIVESFAQQLEKEIAKYDDRIVPAIIPIPGLTGNNGVGIRNLSRSVEQAVGSDIIFG